MNNKFKIFLYFLIILVSAIYGLPNVLLVTKLGNKYDPLVISATSPIARDEAFAYATEAKYIQNGHLFLKELYVKEYESYPTPFMGESLPSHIFAFLSNLTGSMGEAFIAADFIFPPIIFLLLYVAANMFIKNKLYSASIAFLAVIARDFIAVIPFPHETFQYLTSAENQNYLLYLSRAFHPQVTFIFFSLTFIFFIKIAQNPNNKRFILAFGLMFGSLFYSYIFYWTYFLAFLGLTIVYLLIKKEKEILVAVGISTIIALVIAGPYLYNIYKFYQLELVSDFVAKSSLDNVPLPLTLVRYLGVAILFLFTTRRRGKVFNIFALFILAGVLITPVSKFILDQDLETFHYLRRALMPFATIAFFVSIFFLLKGKKNVENTLAIIIVVVFMVYGFNVQIIATNKIQSAHIKDQAMMNVFNWLNSNTPKESVVGSLNTDLESLLPVYTKNRVFFPPTDRTVMPTTEGVTRYALLNDLLGVEKPRQKKNLDHIMSYLFVYQSYDQNLNLDQNSPRRVVAEKEIERVASTHWREELTNFKLDYVVLTPQEKQLATPNSKLIPTVSFGDYQIYKYEK